MEPTWTGGPLRKSDIGKPKDFRHVGGYMLAERIKQFSQPGNTQSQNRPISDANEPIYEDIDVTPATPCNTPTTPSILSPPQPVQRRTFPAPSSTEWRHKIPPPVMAKPRTRLSEPLSSLPVTHDHGTSKSMIVTDSQSDGDISNTNQSEDRDLTSFLQLAADRIAAQENNNVRTIPSENQTETEEITFTLYSDENIYEDVNTMTDYVKSVGNDEPSSNSLEMVEDHFDIPPCVKDRLEVVKRQPVGRSPSTVAALSMLDSVIHSYSECIEEEDDEDYVQEEVKENGVNEEEIEVVESKEEFKEPSDNVESKVSVEPFITPPQPKPRRLFSPDNILSNTTIENGKESKEDSSLKSFEELDLSVEKEQPSIEESVDESTTAASTADRASTASSRTTSWEKDVCLSLDDIADPGLRLLLHKAGVTSKDLKDQATRDFIFQFILDNGGQEAVERETLILGKFKTVAVRKKKKRRAYAVEVVDINIDCDDDDSLGTYL